MPEQVVAPKRSTLGLLCPAQARAPRQSLLPPKVPVSQPAGSPPAARASKFSKRSTSLPPLMLLLRATSASRWRVRTRAAVGRDQKDGEGERSREVEHQPASRTGRQADTQAPGCRTCSGSVLYSLGTILACGTECVYLRIDGAAPMTRHCDRVLPSAP